jgi:polyphosphate kinase
MMAGQTRDSVQPVATTRVRVRGDGRSEVLAPPAAPSRYLNREFSLLDYCERLLARAENQALTLRERVVALHYFAQNLDDFFQIRVAGLKEQLEAAAATVSPDGLTPAAQLAAIRRRVEELYRRQYRLFAEELLGALAEAGIVLVDAAGLEGPDAERVAAYFRERIFPVLTPLAVDPAHPFPYISHLSLNLAALVRHPDRGLSRFARVKVPPSLPRWVEVGQGRLVPLEQVIAVHLPALFPGMRIISSSAFRLTRDNDLEVREEGADDLLVTIRDELLRHRRRAQAVRLEITAEMPEEVLALLVRELELEPDDVYRLPGLLDLSAAGDLPGLDRPDLGPEPLPPAVPPRLVGTPDLFAAIRRGPLLVHHPYESFTGSVVAFTEQAARDPDVLAIKQTLYRTSGPTSPIVLALARAAEAGKQVVALVELKARGDEQANIQWAQALEESGVHVVYGLVGLKTHAKLTLVVRQEPGGIRRYVHVATGNYNQLTALGYEDLGLFTVDPELGADASELFNFLSGFSEQTRYRRMLAAPTGLRPELLRLIREEAKSGDGRIVIKVNSLVDTQIIDALYDAAAAGVEIDLITRSICCLRPGVPGLSERIRVRSIVGRFLEHSRIFRFGSDRRGPRYYIGSPDLMERNLDRRVEVVVPVTDPELQERLRAVLEVLLADGILAWELGPDGSWRPAAKEGPDSQRRLWEMAQERARKGDGRLH